MLILRSSPASPFVRKVRIAASVLGLDREITIELADTANPGDTVRQQNPLGKIPALVLEDGMVLFDSRVILDYLDHRAGGGKIVPKDAAARFAALRLQALADGLIGCLDPADLRGPLAAGRAARAEMGRSPGRQGGAGARIARSRARPAWTPRPNVGQIAVACALGYRDFRFAGTWRKDHPRLVAWLDPLPRGCRPSPRPPRRRRDGATPARRRPRSTPTMIDRVSAVRRRIQRLVYRARRWRRQAVSPDLRRCLVVLRAGDQSLHLRLAGRSRPAAAAMGFASRAISGRRTIPFRIGRLMSRSVASRTEAHRSCRLLRQSIDAVSAPARKLRLDLAA